MTPLSFTSYVVLWSQQSFESQNNCFKKCSFDEVLCLILLSLSAVVKPELKKKKKSESPNQVIESYPCVSVSSQCLVLVGCLGLE